MRRGKASLNARESENHGPVGLLSPLYLTRFFVAIAVTSVCHCFPEVPTRALASSSRSFNTSFTGAFSIISKRIGSISYASSNSEVVVNINDELESDADDEDDLPSDGSLESKLLQKLEHKMKMKLAKKVRLRRKKLVRKRRMRKKGRWPPSNMSKLKNN